MVLAQVLVPPRYNTSGDRLEGDTVWQPELILVSGCLYRIISCSGTMSSPAIGEFGLEFGKLGAGTRLFEFVRKGNPDWLV